MNDEIFFDTTILVYAYDKTELEKNTRCEGLVGTVFKGGNGGVISNQVLAELFSVLTTKMRNPMNVSTAKEIITNFIKSDKWNKLNYNSVTVEKSMLTVEIHKTSFWDALIAETMKENGIYKIYTENEKDFKKIPGIKVINPLKK